MKKIFIFAAALAAMTACNKNVLAPGLSDEDYGFIALNLDADTEIVATKAQTTVEKNGSEYNVTLYKKDGSNFTTVWTKDYKDIAASNLKQPAGTYKIYAENYTVAESLAANNNYGDVRVTGNTDEIDLAAGATEPATVACSPVNAKVSIAYADGFTTTFTSPTVYINGDRRGALEMTPYSTETNADNSKSIAYFSETTTTITYSLTATVNSTEKTWNGNFTITPQKWNKITFSSQNNGSFEITITADDQITEVETVPVNLDPLEGTPTPNPNPNPNPAQ